MAISRYTEELAGRRAESYDPELGITDPKSVAYRIAPTEGDWDWRFTPALEALLADPDLDKLEALIIGPWSDELDDMMEYDIQALVDRLRAEAPRLPSLEALFFGDIPYEYCEISWLELVDVAPLIMAFPHLKTFTVRGGNGLGFSSLRHDELRELVVQAGGLASGTVRQVASAVLPNLEHLELWLGTGYYGGTSTVEDLTPILSGKLFPRLTHLGLKNCDYADDIARAVATAPVVANLKVLDLSMGTMGDEGAEALLANAEGLSHLERLDLSDNYISQESAARLEAAFGDKAPAAAGKSEQYGRYVTHGE